MQINETVKSFSDITKSSLKDVVVGLKYQVDEGKLDHIELLKALTMMKKVGEALTSTAKDNKFKEIAKEYISDTYDSVRKLGLDNELLGARFECSETGVKYDFEVCGDSEWEELNTKVIQYKEMLSEREKFLKTIPKDGLDILNEESGEVSKIFPPSKSSTSTVKVTLK